VFLVYTQNACFGLPSTFDWMEKYPTSNETRSPFDMFDPFANHISAQKGMCMPLIILQCR